MPAPWNAARRVYGASPGTGRDGPNSGLCRSGTWQGFPGRAAHVTTSRAALRFRKFPAIPKGRGLPALPLTTPGRSPHRTESDQAPVRQRAPRSTSGCPFANAAIAAIGFQGSAPPPRSSSRTAGEAEACRQPHGDQGTTRPRLLRLRSKVRGADRAEPRSNDLDRRCMAARSGQAPRHSNRPTAAAMQRSFCHGPSRRPAAPEPRFRSRPAAS